MVVDVVVVIELAKLVVVDILFIDVQVSLNIVVVVVDGIKLVVVVFRDVVVVGKIVVAVT